MLERIPPGRCTATFRPEMWRSPDYIAEEKANGERHMLYLEPQGCYLYSRGDFPRIDKAASVPHIARPHGPQNIVLDGELRWPQATNLQQTSSFLRMTPANAVAAQEAHGKLVYTAFDILHWEGHSVSKLSYLERRGLLEEVVGDLDNPYIQLVKRNHYYRRQFYHTIVMDGGEGIVLKDVRAPYGHGWVKIKKRFDYSVIITGFAPGQGKYAHTLGALRVSVYDGDKLVEVATCSGMTDAERDEFWRRKLHYLGMVVDVFAQEVTEGNRLLHPAYHQLRSDMSAGECTLEKLLTDRRVASYWPDQS